MEKIDKDRMEEQESYHGRHRHYRRHNPRRQTEKRLLIRALSIEGFLIKLISVESFY